MAKAKKEVQLNITIRSEAVADLSQCITAVLAAQKDLEMAMNDFRYALAKIPENLVAEEQ